MARYYWLIPADQSLVQRNPGSAAQIHMCIKETLKLFKVTCSVPIDVPGGVKAQF